MRTDAYVNRLLLATKEQNPDVRKIARMVELTLSKVGSTPAGEDALKLVRTRMIKSAVKQFVSQHEDEIKKIDLLEREVPRALAPPTKETRKRRVFKLNL